MTPAAPCNLTGATPRRQAVYRHSIEETFRFLKQTSRLDELLVKSIVLPRSGGYLAPVCEMHARDAALISLLSRWRRDKTDAFPTQFPVTDAGTASWLRSRLLDVPDRLLFLVLDARGRPLGHLGYANCFNPACAMEIDNVVRGVDGEAPGIMGEAMLRLLDWAEEVIGPDQIFLRVFADNDHAVTFYRKLGFVDDWRIPLRRHVDGETISFQSLEPGDTQPADREFLRMVYAPRRLWSGEMILTAGPSVSAREAWYTLDAARTGWNHQWSGYIKKFETAFAAYVGMPFALATSSCTGALHIALLALGIGPGDEVIVPDITWIATANAVAYTGATPVFADIEPDSWCLDPESFAARITPRTRAVIPVHLYGHPARMDRIVAIARRHGLYIVEDAAPAIGAECAGRRTGSFGDFAAFSFQGAKLLVTGEGGMLLARDQELFRKAYTIWDQGRRPGTFWIDQTGYKYKISNLQAAFGLAQLERVDTLIEAKRRVFSWYAEHLAGTPFIRLNHELPWACSIYWMTSLVLEEGAPVSRDALRDRLRQRNIDTRPVFPAISQYPLWPLRQDPQPVARRIGDRGLNLPSGVCLKREQVSAVCRAVREVLQG